MKRTLFLFVAAIHPIVEAQSFGSPVAILQEADNFADLYNWQAAAEPYQQSEKAFHSQHDSRNALYAHIGYLRATMESANLPKLSVYLGAQGAAATVQNDLQLAMKCYIAKGDVDAEIDSALAQTDWEEVLRLAKQLKNLRWVGRATGEIGFHRYVQGDHATAEKDTALALLAARDSGDFAAQIRFLSGIGTGFEMAGALGQAHDCLDRAQKLADKHPETGYPYMAIAGQIMTLIKENNLQPASLLIKDDLTRSTAGRRYVKFTQARLFLADVAIAQGKDETAIRILEDTIVTAKHNGTRLLTEVYAKLANLYRNRGSLREASAAYASAIASADQSRDMYLAPELMLTLARLKLQLHQNAEAERLFRRATDVVEGMLAQTTEVRIREALLTTMSKVYAGHFALDANRGNLEEAYQTIEQVRGRIVAELLFTKPHNDDLEARDEAIEQNITMLKLRLVSEQSQTSRQKLIDELFYADLRRWTTQTPLSAIREPKISITDVRRVLRPDEVILEYVLNDDESYCLIISKSGMQLAKLPARQAIDSATSSLLAAIHDHKDPVTAERLLFKFLVEPIDSLSKYRYITVVPDGSLHTLPFDVLRNAEGLYWGLQHAISYTPSAGTEYLLRARPESAAPLFLGVGGVTYLSTPSKKNPGATRELNDLEYDLSDIHDLPSSEEEIRTVAALLHLQAYFIVGPTATKTELEKEDLSRFRVVHYAVHAVANPKQPDNAALILRSDPPRNNGFVEARDILRTRLNAELVVLSACDTAVGRLQGEEGIANLAQAFLIAGASSVVPTLWKVDDVYSLFLMKQFYARLSQGQDKAIALQGAKEDLLQKFGPNTDPAFWAGFTLIGDATGRIQLNQNIAFR